MKTIVLTVAALVASGTTADARSARHAAPARTAPIDVTRAAFAAHGQGID